MPANLLRNTGGLVSKDNLVPFLVGGSLTAASFAMDDRMRQELSGSDLGGLQPFGDKLGDAEVVASLTAGLFLAGRVAKGQRFRDMTYDLGQSQLVAGALGSVLKVTVGRTRPNGSNDRSFPSGHSWSWFTIATVVERHYGFWVSLPAYGLWGISALSRVANDTHYWSDVVAGAALGYLVARTTKRVNDAPLPGAAAPPGPTARLQVMPFIAVRGRSLGVAMILEF